MKRTWTSAALCLTLLCAGFCLGASGDEAGEKGRALFEAHKDAVVTVRAVISLSFGGNEDERESWANGTVIDATGLTLLSLTFIDPMALYEAMGQAPEEMTSKVISLKILRPDGEEAPAEVVLRDKDLDLVFVRPVAKPKEPMAYIDITNLAQPQLLETLAVVTQLGEVARRAHSVLLERVETIVNKPRTYYVLGEHRGQALVSSPAFTLDGKFVGIGAMRAIRKESEGRMGDSVLVIIVPSADIQEALKQVPPLAETAP